MFTKLNLKLTQIGYFFTTFLTTFFCGCSYLPHPLPLSPTFDSNSDSIPVSFHPIAMANSLGRRASNPWQVSKISESIGNAYKTSTFLIRMVRLHLLLMTNYSLSPIEGSVAEWLRELVPGSSPPPYH